jgi:hypothetical protein
VSYNRGINQLKRQCLVDKPGEGSFTEQCLGPQCASPAITAVRAVRALRAVIVAPTFEETLHQAHLKVRFWPSTVGTADFGLFDLPQMWHAVCIVSMAGIRQFLGLWNSQSDR